MALTSAAPPILTTAAIRAAEVAAIARGVPEAELMERAGAAAARAILAFGCPPSVSVLCGPGNNGGDGHVVARHLAAAGIGVTVARAAPPAGATAAGMAARWAGPVVPLGTAPFGPCVIDALFGIGLTRHLDGTWQAALDAARGAWLKVAIDVPSGVASDNGNLLGAPLACDLTITFGAMKPAHILEPARSLCGRVVVADIGLGRLTGDASLNSPPARRMPLADAHKYSRGAVLVVGGPAGHGGAARLAARAALRAGAGIVTLAAGPGSLAENAARLDAVMLRDGSDADALTALLADERWRAVIAGPGLGIDPAARVRLAAVLASGRPLVLDGDAFSHFASDAKGLAAMLPAASVLTPHEGEFVRLFGDQPGSKLDRARAAAAYVGAVVLLKGADSVIAAPDGRAVVNVHATPWLATAGAGDVLAGIVAARLASGEDAFAAACAGVWLHGDAGLRRGPGLIAEDLPELLPAVLAGLQ